MLLQSYYVVASRIRSGDFVGGDMTVKGVKIAILGTALHVHHTFWDIYLPPLNYFDVNFPAFKISEGWKHKETTFYSFSVLYLYAVLESLTSEKKFFAKLGSVFLFNSLFSECKESQFYSLPFGQAVASMY